MTEKEKTARANAFEWLTDHVDFSDEYMKLTLLEDLEIEEIIEFIEDSVYGSIDYPTELIGELKQVMTENIIDRKIVKGAKGIADFAMEHIEDLRKGASADFAMVNCEDSSCNLEDFKKDCRMWGGIVCYRSPMDANYDVLYIDSWGGSWCPKIYPVGSENQYDKYLAELIDSVADAEVGAGFKDDEPVYVECVSH